jgi:phosphomannomutase/phosphoglucomutase
VSIFKACDIRGVVGSELNGQIARKIGLALGTLVARKTGDRGPLPHGGPVYVAGDFRRSTPALKQALMAGLSESGAQVIDLGQVPTPVAYFAAARDGCDNLAIVTASHNPGRYNGVKLMVAGQPAVPALIAELQALLDAGTVPISVSAEMGLSPLAGVLPDYETVVRSRAAELSGCEASALARRGLTIAVDAMGGAFYEIAPRVLRQSGCRVVPLHCEVDRDFARHDPNPARESNLAELSRAVVAHRADFGVALDGDGDRAVLMDSQGRIVHPEQFAVVLIQRCFSRPLVVFDLKCASLLAKAAEAAGGKSLMQPSGHGIIKTRMLELEADLGVEVSGHFLFRALGGGDDGLFVALLAAHLIAGSGLSLSELVAPIGWPAITPDLRIALSADGDALLDRIAAGCGGRVSRLDGVRAEYDDGWALARLSITEPLITLRFEASQASGLPDIAARFLRSVPDLCKQVLEALR